MKIILNLMISIVLLGSVTFSLSSCSKAAETKSEAAVKEAGKLRVEGKGYVVADGDVMHFLFNV